VAFIVLMRPPPRPFTVFPYVEQPPAQQLLNPINGSQCYNFTGCLYPLVYRLVGPCNGRNGVGERVEGAENAAGKRGRWHVCIPHSVRRLFHKCCMSCMIYL
jgi:hypothetical protein